MHSKTASGSAVHNNEQRVFLRGIEVRRSQQRRLYAPPIGRVKPKRFRSGQLDTGENRVVVMGKLFRGLARLRGKYFAG